MGTGFLHLDTSLTVGIVEVSDVVVVVDEHELRSSDRVAIFIDFFSLAVGENPLVDANLASIPGSKSVVKIVEVISAKHFIVAVFVELANINPRFSLFLGSSPDAWERIVSSGFISCFDLFFTAEVLDPLTIVIVCPSLISSASCKPSAA